jgi:AraC-like DNA-binding protein
VKAAPGPDRLVSTVLLPGPGTGDVTQAARCIGFSTHVPTPVRRRELPSPYLTLIVGVGDPLLLVGPGEAGTRRVTSFVSGLQNESAVTERHGLQRGVHIELPPLAAYTLLGAPISDLTDQLVDLPSVLGKETTHLVEAVAAARNWPDAFGELRAALVGRMARGPRPAPAVAWVWQQLRATRGSARIDELVRQTGVSHRHLAARFREQVGMTPKAFARVLRFEHSLTLLRRGGPSLASVAAAAGYYDQSHLNRDFRAMAASSPRTFLTDPLAADPPDHRLALG